MIKNYGSGLIGIGNFNIQFTRYPLLDFYIGFHSGTYIPLSLRLGWFEVSFFVVEDWEFECECDEDCCN